MDANFITLLIFSALFSAAIIAYIFKEVLQIPKSHKELEKQTNLLKEIAKKNGVEQSTIEEITN